MTHWCRMTNAHISKLQRSCLEQSKHCLGMRSIKCFISSIALLSMVSFVLILRDGKKSTDLLTQRINRYDFRMNATHTIHQDCCKWDENLLVGRVTVDQSDVDLETARIFNKNLSEIEQGGGWHPKECKAKTKVAIIIPVRHREKHLKVLLRHLHPILKRQRLDYRVFVVNQVDNYPFNKAKLLNVGFVESIKYDDYDCFVFHDVDLIPEDDRNDYGCPSGTRHMCPAVSKFDYKLFSPYLFGGVTAFTRRDFLTVNGYPNRYYGWGAEDDDMFYRVKAKGIRIVRPPMETGRYTMIVHKDEDRNAKAKELLMNAAKLIEEDGLNTLRYKIEARKLFSLYTQIEVNVKMTEDENILTSLKAKS